MTQVPLGSVGSAMGEVFLLRNSPSVRGKVSKALDGFQPCAVVRPPVELIPSRLYSFTKCVLPSRRVVRPSVGWMQYPMAEVEVGNPSVEE